MDALDVLEQLESASGANAKIQILSDNKDNVELVFLLDAALNFDRKFYIKKFDVVSNPARQNVSITAFADLLNALQNRSVTGNSAKNWVESLLGDCTALQQKWYSRVLLKDLKCNFGISSCAKAGIDIPEFEVMLAKDGRLCKNLDKIVKEGVYVSPKFDGYRCLAIVGNGCATLHSRNGKEFENFPTIQAAMVAACEAVNPDETFVLDSEIMSDSFGDMQRSAFAAKRGTTVGDVKAHIFDMIPHNEWISHNFKTKAVDRFKNFNHFLRSYQGFGLASGSRRAFGETSVEEILKLESEYLSKGYEGAMILPNIPYYLGRKTNALMKFKTMLTMDCEIMGIYEGEGKYIGAMGGFKIKQENGVMCSVGSGFSDEERQMVWDSATKPIGWTCEVKYQNLSEDGVARFPIFIRYRTDK